jgi:hypothetical protein
MKSDLGEWMENAIIRKGTTSPARPEESFMKRMHLAAGLLTVTVFLYTGFHMQSGFPALYQANESIRYLYRANHVYLLLAGLLNIVLGVYLSPVPEKWRTFLQHLGSLPILLAPPVLVYAFFYEAPQGSPERDVTFIGILCLLVGTLCHLLQRVMKDNREALAIPEVDEELQGH